MVCVKCGIIGIDAMPICDERSANIMRQQNRTMAARQKFGVVVIPASVISLITLLLSAAEIWGPQQKCELQFPKIIGCTIGSYETLAGSLMGAGGALLAAWIAWRLIRGQIAEQKRATLIADRSYWQQQRNEAEVSYYGLGIVVEVVNTCLAEFDAIRNSDKFPYIEALKRIQPSGVLDQSQWPPTGRELISWDINILIALLRQRYNTVGLGQNDHLRPTIENDLHEAAGKLRTISDKIQTARNEREQDIKRARETLQALDSEIAI